MIKPFQVTALRYGELTADWSQLVYLWQMGTNVTCGIWGAAIEGAGKKILVDLGGYEPEYTSRHIIPTTRSAAETPQGLLQHLGWDPAEVDMVIFTHLHWDHIGDSLRPFKNARFIVQQREWEFAQQPISPQVWAYFSFREVGMDPEIEYFQWQFVHGEVEVLPGLKLIPTPGHTPGHQSVLVKTAEGPLFIAGDAVNMMENLDTNRPSGITENAGEYMGSMDRVRALGSRLIAAHDLTLRPFQTGDFPRVPALEQR